MITIDSVHLSFSKGDTSRKVLDNISFRVEQQTSCAIIGPSGCGKTSLLFLLAGLLKPDSGSVLIRENQRCGTILQNYGLFPWKTVAQNIGLGLQLQKEKKDIIARRTFELLEDMGLQGYAGHYPAELSGGMQQRVALARALAISPQILLMDEPLSSLDALTRERLQNLIAEIWRFQEITKVLVTHSIEEAVFLGQKILVLSQRPARLLYSVDNPEAGTVEYRQSEKFFQRCNELRQVIGGELYEKKA